MPRLAALQAEWRARPPAHWLLGAALNYRPRADPGESTARHATAAQLRAAFPAGRL